MKKTLLSVCVAALLATACTKQNQGSDDSITTNATSATQKSGVEDNPNGGGGDNIPAASVPAAVMASFKSLYPDARVVEWKKKNGNYKVEFFRAAVRWESIFSPAGKLLKQEHL